MSGPLKKAWIKRKKQMDEYHKLADAAQKLYDDAYKLRSAANLAWIDTVIEAHGGATEIEWTANGCKVGGKLFKYKEAK